MESFVEPVIGCENPRDSTVGGVGHPRLTAGLSAGEFRYLYESAA
ncbi:hypothetical protein [Mycolicibacterium obuense]|nr:hypothetical protein [Mycolicibacterium obuense]